MISVVLWYWREPGRQKKWGRFTFEHVNRAAAMIRANLGMQHEIVCITDQPEAAFDSQIRVVQIWPDHADLGRCWRRLKAFSPEMRDLIGPRFVWIDLDCCVTGDLTPLFDRPEDIVLWRSQTTRCPYNGSMVLMTAGARPQVWDDFRPRVDFSPRYPGTDQSWIGHKLGHHEAVWSQADGVLAYNAHFRRKPIPQEPPEHARIVFFPGSVKSNSDVVRRGTPWVQGILDQYGEVDEPGYLWEPRRNGKGMRRVVRPKRPRERRGVQIRAWA